jgi:hypothetical protein
MTLRKAEYLKYVLIDKEVRVEPFCMGWCVFAGPVRVNQPLWKMEPGEFGNIRVCAPIDGPSRGSRLPWTGLTQPRGGNGTLLEPF